MKIISSSSGAFTVGVTVYDKSGYPVQWDSLHKVNVEFELAGNDITGFGLDPQTEKPELELKASEFNGYPDGVLYYNYIATRYYYVDGVEKYDEYTGRAQTDYYIQLSAKPGTTCATSVSELVNDAGYVNQADLDSTLEHSFKTINGQSIVGSGNIEIQGGGSVDNETDPVFTGWVNGMSVAAGSNAEAAFRYGVALGVGSKTYSGVAIRGSSQRITDSETGAVISAGNGTAINGSVQATGGTAVGGTVYQGANYGVVVGMLSRVQNNAANSVVVGYRA